MKSITYRTMFLYLKVKGKSLVARPKRIGFEDTIRLIPKNTKSIKTFLNLIIQKCALEFEL